MLLGVGTPPHVLPNWLANARSSSERLWNLQSFFPSFSGLSGVAVTQDGSAGAASASPHTSLAQLMWNAALDRQSGAGKPLA
jgi:hypothetical protein